jgi:hypothetical protein
MPGREPWEWAEYLGIGQGVEECTDCGGTGEIEDLTPVLYAGPFSAGHEEPRASRWSRLRALM